jgi:hypothetical protein
MNLPNEDLEISTSSSPFIFCVQYICSLFFFALPLLVVKSLIIANKEMLFDGAKGFSVIILIFVNHEFRKKFRKENGKKLPTGSWFFFGFFLTS